MGCVDSDSNQKVPESRSPRADPLLLNGFSLRKKGETCTLQRGYRADPIGGSADVPGDPLFQQVRTHSFYSLHSKSRAHLSSVC